MPTESYVLKQVDSIPERKSPNIFFRAIMEFLDSEMDKAEIKFKTTIAPTQLRHAIQGTAKAMEAPIYVHYVDGKIYLERYHRV